MLSKNQVVATRKAIEKLYTHTCSVVIKEKIKKQDHSTGFTEKVLFENQPCRISFSSISTVSENSHANLKQQTIKLFIAPDLKIDEGSKIIVNHDGIKSLFSKSGVSALYPTHQEINLEIFKGWA